MASVSTRYSAACTTLVLVTRRTAARLPMAPRITKATSWALTRLALRGLLAGGTDRRGAGPAFRDAAVRALRQLLGQDPVHGLLIGLDVLRRGPGSGWSGWSGWSCRRRRRGRGRRGGLHGGGGRRGHRFGLRWTRLLRRPRSRGGDLAGLGRPRGQLDTAAGGDERLVLGLGNLLRRFGSHLELRRREDLVRPLLQALLLVGHLDDVVFGVLELRAPEQGVERAHLHADPAVHAQGVVDGEPVQHLHRAGLAPAGRRM